MRQATLRPVASLGVRVSQDPSSGLNLNTTPQAIILHHVRTQTKELIEARSKRYSKTLKYYSMKSLEQKLKSRLYVLVDLAYKRRAVRSTTLRSTTL